MALREELREQGTWLFKWRGYFPFVLGVFFAWALVEYEPFSRRERLDEIAAVLCLLVSAFGMFLRAVTLGYAPRGTSGRNTRRQIATELSTTGMYSVVRHPLYLGNFFLGLGVVLFLNHLWFAVVYCLGFALFYERIMATEETFLRESFGAPYEEWAGRTPAFFPRFSGWRGPELPFSMRSVLRREHHGLVEVVAIFFVLRVATDFVSRERFVLRPGWIAFLVVGLVAWITLRFLKKRTGVLDVEGR